MCFVKRDLIRKSAGRLFGVDVVVFVLVDVLVPPERGRDWSTRKLNSARDSPGRILRGRFAVVVASAEIYSACGCARAFEEVVLGRSLPCSRSRSCVCACEVFCFLSFFFFVALLLLSPLSRPGASFLPCVCHAINLAKFFGVSSAFFFSMSLRRL